MDRVFLDGLTFYGYHGVNPEERQLGQRFVVSVSLTLDLAPAGQSDQLVETINYAEVYRLIREVIEGPPVHLLETLAERVAHRLLEGTSAGAARVRIEKPWAPIKGMVSGTAGVEITRQKVG